LAATPPKQALLFAIQSGQPPGRFNEQPKNYRPIIFHEFHDTRLQDETAKLN